MSHHSDAVRLSMLLLPGSQRPWCMLGKATSPSLHDLGATHIYWLFLWVDLEISRSTNTSVCLLIVILFHVTTSGFFFSECAICIGVCVCVCVYKCVESVCLSLVSELVSLQRPHLPSHVLFFSFFLHPPPVLSHQTMKTWIFPMMPCNLKL